MGFVDLPLHLRGDQMQTAFSPRCRIPCPLSIPPTLSTATAARWQTRWPSVAWWARMAARTW